MKIAVLGSGPAGLLAAHAATRLGHKVYIYAHGERSHIQGAQYIHDQIDGLTEEVEPFIVSYAKVGDSTGYAEKVYGSPLAPSSWAKFPQGEYPAWPMDDVYDLLWDAWGDRVTKLDITRHQVEPLIRQHDMVLSSIPANAICYDEDHKFKGAEVVFEPHCYVDMEDIVVYSGRRSEDWYRTSNLRGHAWTEYSRSMWQHVPPRWRSGVKPTETTCDCWTTQLHRIGRFGKWEKAQLVTDAYHDAVRLLGGVHHEVH